MPAYNIVRFRVKPGRDQEFIAINKQLARNQIPGFQGGALIKTGERSYCFVGEWDKFDSIVKARPQMVANLEQMRPMLEDLGGGLGVTDPVSGEAVAEF
jgi:hypothetical protein